MKAAIYGRVWPVGQTEPASSLTTQREKTQAAFPQRGWKLAGEYIDEGISRTKDHRAQWQAIRMPSRTGPGGESGTTRRRH